MKKIYLFFIGIASLLSFEACSNDSFTGKYEDPSKTTTSTCPKLMTGAFVAGNQYTFNSYWRMYTWENVFGKYTQTCGFQNNSGSVYYVNDGYIADRWNNFYQVLAQYRQLENIYNNENSEAKNNDKIFKDAAEIYLYDHLSQLVDLFGSVPFSKACYLGITGDVPSSYASYDNDKTLYTNVLSRLGEIYTELKTMKGNMTSLVTSSFTHQDYICKGDINKWMKYCNSLRLRLAIHVSAQGDLTKTGRDAVKEILDGNLPLVTNLDDEVEVYPDGDGFNYEEQFRDGFKDINSYASQALVDAMTPFADQKDYRLPIIYVPNAVASYIGMSVSETSAEQDARMNLTYAKRYYARLDSATYTANKNFISPIISAAEVYFLKAEAYQNGWATGGTAYDAFLNGVLYSTKFYYKQNSLSATSYGYKGTIPSDNIINAYADRLWNNDTNKLRAIMTQKWIHLGIIQPTQAWTDIRRTGYPSLTYPTDATAQVYTTLPNRVRYPNVEASNNTTNYNAAVSAMGGKGDASDGYIKLFWAK